MSKGSQIAGLVAGLALIGVYSWIMMATNGNGGWAWILLLAGIVVLVLTARAAAADREA